MKWYLNYFIALIAIQGDLYAAEAGMPQLDPKYWASQAFWLILVFVILYISLSKFYLPKIKSNLDNRENKIKEDLENANKFKEQSESKLKEYELILDKAKKEVNKINVQWLDDEWHYFFDKQHFIPEETKLVHCVCKDFETVWRRYD